MWISDQWKDFCTLDASNGEKLELWGRYKLIRPDPQAIWNTPKSALWKNPSAHYHRSSKGGGSWEIFDLPEVFTVSYRDLVFRLKPMSFKHTGLFPEQACNWDWAADMIARSPVKQPKILNLFAYTGGASLACSKAGGLVCHVDASKGMTQWAKENAEACGISNIRFIVDDCIKFVSREIRRGNRYDAVIMDPPSYGRGPGGEVWKLENELYSLLSLCLDVMSEKPLFFLLNSYTTGLSAGCMEYMLGVTIAKRFGGCVTASESGLPVRESGYILPCGASARWTSLAPAGRF